MSEEELIRAKDAIPSDKLVIEVPLDPQPPSGYGLYGIPFGHVIFMERNYKTAVPTLKCSGIHRVRVPYQKDDILELGEDRKVKVEQVLGVEEVEIYHDVNDNHYIEKLWHYRLLVSERENAL